MIGILFALLPGLRLSRIHGLVGELQDGPNPHGESGTPVMGVGRAGPANLWGPTSPGELLSRPKAIRELPRAPGVVRLPKSTRAAPRSSISFWMPKTMRKSDSSESEDPSCRA